MKHAEVQNIAKQTISYLKGCIKVGMALPELRRLAEDKMKELGADSFWYWDIGAFVFSGEETTVSVSGKQYKTSDNVINNDDIITVDLSPQVGNIWGDYARTIIIENGSVVTDINNIKNSEWKNGLLIEDLLHSELLAFVTPQTTFEQVYNRMNKLISDRGYINLDFMGNLGHSIVTDKNDRIYIEKGNTAALGSVNYFTFEPHIAQKGSKYGYKKENIYHFENGKLTEI